MRTVLTSTKSSIKCKKSEFIAIILHVDIEKEVYEQLIKIKKDYPKAKHYCYAYRINEKYRSSDDKEPSGTAGAPLMQLINQNELDEVLLVVVRYFGGVLLGASNLLRTYLQAGEAVIKSAKFYKIVYFYQYHVEADYDIYQKILAFGNSIKALFENIDYGTTIKFSMLTIDDCYDSISSLLLKKGNVTIANKTKKYIIEEV